MFSHRTEWSFAHNQLMSRLEDLQVKDAEIFNLTESNPTLCEFQFLSDVILKPFGNAKNLTYRPSPQGSLETRQAICAYYQEKGSIVHPEQIILTSSSSESYSFLFRLLLNPQERILIGRPSYPLFEFLAQLNDVHMDYYSLVYGKGWSIDFASLKEALTAKTRSLILVNPNNPTGNFIKSEELETINTLCKAGHMALICDEVFLDYGLDQKIKPFSLVSNSEVLTFTLGGISKSLALPQMKIGWIVVNGPKDLVKEAMTRLEIIADTYLSVNTPSQNAFCDWFTLLPAINKEILGRLHQNKVFLQTCLIDTPGCHYLQNEGGWYAIIKLPEGQEEESWVMEFLEKDHVFVHPGYFFDFEEEPFIIVSLLTLPAIFQEGIRRIIARASLNLKT